MHFGIKVETTPASSRLPIDFSPCPIRDFQSAIDAWLPLSFALNNKEMTPCMREAR